MRRIVTIKQRERDGAEFYVQPIHSLRFCRRSNEAFEADVFVVVRGGVYINISTFQRTLAL